MGADGHRSRRDRKVSDPATVRVGDALDTPRGPERVVRVDQEVRRGAIHLVTPSGAYYVDGVAASTYVAYIPHAAWKVVGDGYITLRYALGAPFVPEGDAPISLFWFLDALRALGVPDAVQSTLLWPLIPASVVATELACAAPRALAATALGAHALLSSRKR